MPQKSSTVTQNTVPGLPFPINEKGTGFKRVLALRAHKNHLGNVIKKPCSQASPTASEFNCTNLEKGYNHPSPRDPGLPLSTYTPRVIHCTSLASVSLSVICGW